jgi:hypothetical protein
MKEGSAPPPTLSFASWQWLSEEAVTLWVASQWPVTSSTAEAAVEGLALQQPTYTTVAATLMEHPTAEAFQQALYQRLASPLASQAKGLHSLFWAQQVAQGCLPHAWVGVAGQALIHVLQQAPHQGGWQALVRSLQQLVVLEDATSHHLLSPWLAALTPALNPPSAPPRLHTIGATVATPVPSTAQVSVWAQAPAINPTLALLNTVTTPLQAGQRVALVIPHPQLKRHWQEHVTAFLNEVLPNATPEDEAGSSAKPWALLGLQLLEHLQAATAVLPSTPSVWVKASPQRNATPLSTPWVVEATLWWQAPLLAQQLTVWLQAVAPYLQTQWLQTQGRVANQHTNTLNALFQQAFEAVKTPQQAAWQALWEQWCWLFIPPPSPTGWASTPQGPPWATLQTLLANTPHASQQQHTLALFLQQHQQRGATVKPLPSATPPPLEVLTPEEAWGSPASHWLLPHANALPCHLQPPEGTDTLFNTLWEPYAAWLQNLTAHAQQVLLAPLSLPFVPNGLVLLPQALDTPEVLARLNATLQPLSSAEDEQREEELAGYLVREPSPKHQAPPLVQGVYTEPATPLPLSASGLQTYLKCPRQYFWQSQLKVPTESAESSLKGELLHALMEAFNQQATPHTHTAERLLAMAHALLAPPMAVLEAVPHTLSEATASFWLGHPAYHAWSQQPALKREDWRQTSLLALANLDVQGYFAKPIQSVWAEYAFQQEPIVLQGLPHVAWRGSMDAVVWYADGSVAIWDYKRLGGGQFTTKLATSQSKLLQVFEPLPPATNAHTVALGGSPLFEAEALNTNGNERYYQLWLYPLVLAALHPSVCQQPTVVGLQGLRPAPAGGKLEEGSVSLPLPFEPAAFWDSFGPKAQAVLEDLEAHVLRFWRADASFTPNPSQKTCQYCAFAPHCDAHLQGEEPEPN